MRRREMSKSPTTTTTTTTTSVHPRNPSPSLASTTRSSSPVKSTPTIKSSPPSPSHAPHHHHVVQEKPKSRYKKNKQECKRKPKVLFKNSTSWFPVRSSTRPTTGRCFLQVEQDLASWKTSSPTAAGTYPLRCKSSWYFPKKDSYSRHFCPKAL